MDFILIRNQYFAPSFSAKYIPEIFGICLFFVQYNKKKNEDENDGGIKLGRNFSIQPQKKIKEVAFITIQQKLGSFFLPSLLASYNYQYLNLLASST